MGFRKKRNQGGFTILEVLIAVSVFSFALLALAQMQIMAIQTNATSQQRTTAITLAQDKMEILKRLPYTQISTGNDVSGLFARSWNVQNDFPSSGMKTINLTVSWAAGSKAVTLQTMVTQ
jgi:type IV pilus modification protein PilV